MEKVIRNVADLDAADRRAIEHLIGKRLAECQQVIISVADLDPSRPGSTPAPAAGDMPLWWNVYEGLTEEEVERLDGAIRRRANLTRSFE